MSTAEQQVCPRCEGTGNVGFGIPPRMAIVDCPECTEREER